MKVLQLIDTLDAGGAERMAVNIANAVLKEGCTSYLCTTRREGALKDDINEEVTFLNLNKKGKLDIKAFRTFFKWLKKEEIQIIHAHSTSIFLAVLAKINNRRLKIVWHDHYGLSEQIEKRPLRFLKIAARYIDTAIAVNNTLAVFSREVLGIKNVHFLKNFAQLSSSNVRQTTLQGKNGKRIVCLANLRPQKNHLALIKGFENSLSTHPEWTLHLVGQTFNDDYSESIHTYIKTRQLDKKVFLYGSRRDVTHILSQASMGILVSLSEGLPVSLLEYGASSLPVIVTDVGQCAEVVGDNGIIIDNATTQLQDALKGYYKLPSKELEMIGARFRESVQETYSSTAFMKRLVPIYNDLLY